MGHPPQRNDRRRLTPHDLDTFAGDTLFDTVGRMICEASCLARKELHESWEVARKVLRRHRGGPILDLAGGHGLVGWLMLLQDRSSTVARVVDTRIPTNHHRLREALGARWPDVTARWTAEEADLRALEVPPDARLLGIHACGGLTDSILTLAIAHRSRVAVLPCCHSKAKLDAGGLTGWLDHDIAVDTTRAARLRQAGFRVHTTRIPDDITPKNRLLLGTPGPSPEPATG